MQAWAASVESGGGARRQPCEKDRREGASQGDAMQQSDESTVGTGDDRRAKGEASWQWMDRASSANTRAAAEGEACSDGLPCFAAKGGRGWTDVRRRRPAQNRVKDSCWQKRQTIKVSQSVSNRGKSGGQRRDKLCKAGSARQGEAELLRPRQDKSRHVRAGEDHDHGQGKLLDDAMARMPLMLAMVLDGLRQVIRTTPMGGNRRKGIDIRSGRVPERSRALFRAATSMSSTCTSRLLALTLTLIRYSHRYQHIGAP
ncbi:hypothetical protein V8C42DRAFT_326983 [Trichoderma barbatum]